MKTLGPPESRAYHRIRAYEDINKARSNMAKGNYPISMSDCEVVGIQGDCGPECPVKLKGECEHWED